MHFSENVPPYKVDPPKHLNEGPSSVLPDGFPFEPESHIRRLAEPAALGIFPYVAGMTIMDDRIAAAVDRHSSFVTQPWSRLFRTIRSAGILVFGSENETRETAERLYKFHQTINGVHEPVHYNANDADAQTWVLASLFDGLKQARRRWAPPEFTPAQEEGLYQDIRTFGQFFGIDVAIQPQNVAELNAYWEGRLSGGQLLQTAISKKMAHTVFRFAGPSVPASVGKIGQAISIASLDPRIQEQADLHPDPLDTRIARVFDASMRGTYGRIPESVRMKAIPAYLAANRGAAPIVGRLKTLKLGLNKAN